MACGSGWWLGCRLVTMVATFSGIDPMTWCCGSYLKLVELISNPSGLNPMLLRLFMCCRGWIRVGVSGLGVMCPA